MNTSDLQRALHADAALAGPPPADLLDRIDGLGRRRRKRRAVSLAVAAVIAVTVPTAAGLLDSRETGSTAGAERVHIYDLPTRGSLAEDTALVAAVAELSWPAAEPDATAGGVVDPSPGSRTVAFLGDVADTRYALVTGKVDGDLYAAWFTAPVGADASGFVLASSKYITGQDPLAFADTTVASPVVLVVAAPSDRIDFSDRAVLAADGTISRSYTAGQQLDEGIAAVPTTQAGVSAVSFRVTHDGVVTYRSIPDVKGPSRSPGLGSATPSDEPVQVADPRGLAGAIDPVLVSGALADIATPLQLPLDQVQPTLLWAGSIPAPANQTSTAVVVGITAPSGASIAYGLAFTGLGDGAYAITIGGWQTYDSSHPLLDQAQLIRNVVTDGSASGQPTTSLLLLDPVSSADMTLQATLSSPDGDVTQTTNGVLVRTEDTDTSSAVLLDVATGQVLLEVQLMAAGFTDQYDYGHGPA